MKSKFKCGELVKYKTQTRIVLEPFIITARLFYDTIEKAKGIMYWISNSNASRQNVPEEVLEKYEKETIK